MSLFDFTDRQFGRFVDAELDRLTEENIGSLDVGTDGEYDVLASFRELREEYQHRQVVADFTKGDIENDDD